MKHKIGIFVVDYDVYIKYLNGIKNQIEKGNCEVCAITNGWLPHSRIGMMDGFVYYDIGDFLRTQYDYIVIASNEEDYQAIKGKIINTVSCGYDSIFSISIFGIADFDFNLYIRLVKSNISIISCNCWGGITYANLFLKFLSPTINLRFENEDHFIKFVSRIDHYLQQDIKYDGIECDNLIGEYPAGIIDDVRIRFVHYKTFEEAVEKWNKRKLRINKNNILAMLLTENPEKAKQFSGIDGLRKIVFTGGDYGVGCQVDLSPMYDISPISDIEKITMLLANGELHLYNIIRMLNGDKDYIETINK